MPVIKSNIVKGEKGYQENYKYNKALARQLKKLESDKLPDMESPEVAKHFSRGKMLAMERVENLLDKNTGFLELSSLAAIGQYDDQFPGAGLITGIGIIHGREVVVVANDATIKGGTYVKETIQKHLRAQEIAIQNNIPIVYLVDSGGIFLPEQANVYPGKDHFGRIFYNQAQLSAMQIPQIAVVMGYCTAGGAYIPAMCDENIIVRNSGMIFLAGPSLVEAATGEKVTGEELGGAEVHTSISGVADHLAENDEHALEICRNIFKTLSPATPRLKPKTKIIEPLYEIKELYGIIASKNEKNYRVHDLIARVVDASDFLEFKSNYGKTIITGFATIFGYTVGIVANNGVLFSDSALKATHFIELCNYRGIPLLFLHNITGFIVGKEYEHGGITKDGAKMVHAVATATVPKITIITGNSAGAGNYAMAGRAYQPNFLFVYPNARISVMGGEQATKVLLKTKSKNKQYTAEELQNLEEKVKKQFEEESSAFYSTSRLWDDGVIDPAQTRQILGMCLSVVSNQEVKAPKTGVHRM